MMKPQGTVYVCSDWTTSALVFPILESKLQVRNRITWEREKGRGAKRNWKNNTEDIWFCTVSDEYYFDVDAVKLRRRVIAPYRVAGEPQDWTQDSGGNYRMTHPSNIWTDITVPFWSMPENTDHPTQKPEKLIAKLILASSKKGDYVFDPFVGSGTPRWWPKSWHADGVESSWNPSTCAGGSNGSPLRARILRSRDTTMVCSWRGTPTWANPEEGIRQPQADALMKSAFYYGGRPGKADG